MIKIKNHCILSTGMQLVYLNGQCDPESFLKVDVQYNVLKVSKYEGFFLSVFSCIRTEIGDLLCKSPCSVRIQENTDKKKPSYLDTFHAVTY